MTSALPTSESCLKGQPKSKMNSTEKGAGATTGGGLCKYFLNKRQRDSFERSPLFREVTGIKKHNIVIFGETGTGKSSVVNMLSDNKVANTSNAALGCTFDSTPHDITIDGIHCTVWDTAGLNEGEMGSVSAERALHNLQDLVGEKLKDGISLLVYCIRGSRYREILKVNYHLFVETICRKAVPVVVVITGLENEEPTMEAWWDRNFEQLAERGLNFKGHACITASRGKRDGEGHFMFAKEYEDSKWAVRNLLKQTCPLEVAWVVDNPQKWLNYISSTMEKYYVTETHGEDRNIMIPILRKLRLCIRNWYKGVYGFVQSNRHA